MDSYFLIGAVVGAQGLSGEIKVVPITDDPKRFELLKSAPFFFDLNEKYSREFKINKVRYHKSFVLLKLNGIDDRTAAEKLIGAKIKIPPEQAVPLDVDEYFFRDLIDLPVCTDEGESLGILCDILRTGANDVYVVRSKTEEILIPAIKSCVLSVTPEKMTVRLPDGLRN